MVVATAPYRYIAIPVFYACLQAGCCNTGTVPVAAEWDGRRAARVLLVAGCSRQPRAR